MKLPKFDFYKKVGKKRFLTYFFMMISNFKG